MSLSGACGKKAICNPPVAAAVETADRLTDLLSREVAAGRVSEDDAESLILALAGSDERYLEEQHAIQRTAHQVLSGKSLEQIRERRPTSGINRGETEPE